MQKSNFKSLIITLLSCLIFIYPLSISAAIFQKQTTQNPTTVFEKKRELKQSLFQRFIQKRIEKAIKRQTNRNFEQEQPNQTLGLIALIFMFVGVIFLLLQSGIGFLLIIVALILSIIGLILEDNSIYARRAFWFSLLITLYFLAKIFKVF